MSKRGVVLVILDGWGIGKEDESNPIHVVNPSNINYIKSNFPSGSLQASGISVGLPWGEEGNSEVGHLNLGAGKTIYQAFPKITLAIKDQSFFKNEVIKSAFGHAKKNNSAVNLVGLLGSGNVHSSLEHLLALIDFSQKENVLKLNLHIFTDGRDSLPESALELLKKIPKEKLASLSGRFFAMDRDNHWERTKEVYELLIGNGPIIDLAEIDNHVKQTYSQKYNDEYIKPVLVGPEKRPIQDNDAVIFFNFREDRVRQIVSPFTLKDFNKFPAKKFSNLFVATMTHYQDDFDAPVAFPPEKVDVPLSKVLAQNGKIQFRIAETQKYPHITYFFNGLREEPFSNEYRVLIPSRPILKQDEHPEMMALEITNRLLESINEGVYDFILVNFANPDMIAHTGNYDASIKAVQIIDEQIGKILQICLDKNIYLLITSDHGNIERVYNPATGKPETQHDPSPVPIYLIAKDFERRKSPAEVKSAERGTIGILADVSPTILELLALPKPKEMTGQSLLRMLLA